MEENSEFIARNLEKLDKQDQLLMFEQRHSPKQCESVVVLMKILRITFFKVGDMVKMKHHEGLSLNLDGKVHIMWRCWTSWDLLDYDSSRTSTAECSQSE
ncbi:hypothetical protein BASA81_013359 [Batrachochytrium salamandrivorans]|nr:hypothetical protein BASA81_013359 [Batrachochytrium salamandrivorans]